MHGRTASIAVFNQHGQCLVMRRAGLFTLPTRPCGPRETPMQAAKRAWLEGTGIRLKGKLLRAIRYGYLCTTAVPAETEMSAPLGWRLEWRHPSQMDDENAQHQAFNRAFFGALRGVGYSLPIPGMGIAPLSDPKDKFKVT